jgi:hypothetical protein
MIFNVPAELKHNPELYKALGKQLLTPEQYNDMFPSPMVRIKFVDEDCSPLTDFIKRDFPTLTKNQARKVIQRIYIYLTQEKIVSLPNESGVRTFIMPYGKRTGKTMKFYEWAYNSIIKDVGGIDKLILDEFETLPELIKRNNIGPMHYARVIYGLLENSGYILRSNKGRRPTPKGKPYMKTVATAKGSGVLFHSKRFLKLLELIQFKEVMTKKPSKVKGYSITDICNQCGHTVDPSRAHCDLIIKEINKDLKLKCLIEKPDGKRWRFTKEGIAAGWGYNEIKGKTVQAKYYNNKLVLDYIKKLISELEEEL